MIKDKCPKNEHEEKITISVDVFVPDHPDRTNTPIFSHSRKVLISGNPNAACEVNNGECEGGLELHHDWVEWCDSDGVDWEKVKAAVPDFNWDGFNPDAPETFIDSVFNAKRVLCKKHHTGKDHGIHYLPYPIWQMQKFKRNDFVFSPDEESSK
jgi:hypothetical protein